MGKGEPTELTGTVIQVLPGDRFRVVLANGREVLAHLSGEMRKKYVRICAGDKVNLELSLPDEGKARITSWHSSEGKPDA